MDGLLLLYLEDVRGRCAKRQAGLLLLWVWGTTSRKKNEPATVRQLGCGFGKSRWLG